MTVAASHTLARLAALRRRREDRAREDLARGHSRLSQAQANHDSEAALRDAMVSALPVRQALHLDRATRLAQPEDSLTAFLSALLDDRAHVDRQTHATETALADCELAASDLERLRALYLQTLRRREATETLATRQLTTERQRQSLRDEDLASDQARSLQKRTAT